MRITASQALDRLQGNGLARRAKGEPLHLLDRMRSSRQDRLFIFGRGGTAIVAPADDTLPAQLADFSFESGVINPAAQLMLDDYASQVKAVQEGGIDEVWTPPTASPEVYVAPLMGDIAWHQHEPFNDGLEFVEVKPTKGLVEYANLSDTPRGGKGATQDCFNVYTIDRTNKVVRVSRVGANVSITGERKFMTIAYSE